MTIKQGLSSKFSQRSSLQRLLYSGWLSAVVGLVTGALTILALWQYNPIIALLCIPMVPSVLTALALMFALPVKNRRQRLR
jgi:ABC-type bacteriocin/lantibiotic exporter with double-glycine peptidase domain